MENRITLRSATESDLPTVNMFASAEGMDAIPSAEHVHLACNEAGETVGFIRLAFDEEGVCHVNPVVVYPTWRGHGVGEKLMNMAHERYGEVRLVSRGTSRAFYEALGYSPIAWKLIHKPIVDECSACPLAAECNPQPMGIAEL